MKRDPGCTRCALHKTTEHVCLLGQGPRNAKAMLIGEAPGKREEDIGKPFQGRAGQLLDTMLKNVGLKREELFITNAVSCRPPDNRTPKTREIDACRYWLQEQFEYIKPKYVMLMGNVALESVFGVKGIKRMRGKPIEKDGIIYLPAYHPSYILRGDLKEQPLAERDLRLLREIIEFGGIPEERALNFTIVNTWAAVERMLDALEGVVSFDIETTGLYPWAQDGNVVLMGFGTRAGEFCVPMFHRDSNWNDTELRTIIGACLDRLRDCTVVMHNGKFDALWMLVRYGVTFRIDFDTMLAHYIVDENAPHALDKLAQVYFSAPDWDIPLPMKQGGAPIDILAKYHAHDVYYTRKLYYRLRTELAGDPEVKRVFYKLLMPCANLYVRMEYRGCYIDTDRMAEVERQLLTSAAQAEQRLKKWGDINWASPKQVASLLYGKLGITSLMKTKKGADSTSESALKMIEHPCVSDLLTLRGHRQQLSFFIEGWKPYIVKRRIHPSFKLHGTVTGRPSCEHPNFQQVPRDANIRSLISAPPGYALVEADLSQIELRIAAEFSQVPSMLEAFRTGLDIHWKTALSELERYVGQAELVVTTAKQATQAKHTPGYAEAIEILRTIGPDAAADIDKRWKEIRKKAKAVNFGYLYGMWWKKFKLYARDNYDMHLTDAEAQASRTNFFQLYPLEDWHKEQRKTAYHLGYVPSPTGRKRRLPLAQGQHDTPERAEALRQAINSPVQSFASDINLMILLQIAEEFPNIYPTITVHDSILMEVPLDRVVAVCKRILELAKCPALFEDFGISLSVPIESEVKIGSWGSGVSLNKWSNNANVIAFPARQLHRVRPVQS